MACLGVHFALTAEEVATLKAFEEDEERLEHVQEVIEERYLNEQPELTAQTDKAWDAMHRLLGDGDLSYEEGPVPLRFTVLGGEPLYFEEDYVMSLKSPAEVNAVASTLPGITKEEFRQRYDAMDEGKYGCPKSDEDFEYTWEWFGGVVALYQKAAAEGRYVLFTVDQ
jgi:hypothetical protein